MAKAPLIRDAVLGGHSVTLVGCPESVHCTLYSGKVNAEQLRRLADDLDRLQAAVNVFFEIQEYAVTYNKHLGDGVTEDSVIIHATSETEALLAFDAQNLGKAKCVYNRVTLQTTQVD